MKILIDMNLSPNRAGFLKSAGIESLHWSEVVWLTLRIQPS
jgi:predicted nuclease of predicted toxin-antitoxin system